MSRCIILSASVSFGVLSIAVLRTLLFTKTRSLNFLNFLLDSVFLRSADITSDCNFKLYWFPESRWWNELRGTWHFKNWPSVAFVPRILNNTSIMFKTFDLIQYHSGIEFFQFNCSVTISYFILWFYFATS